MDRLKSRFAFAADAEIAIELDPTSLPDDRRDALAPMGVTRISLGVQDLEPAVQTRHRPHAVLRGDGGLRGQPRARSASTRSTST